MPALRLNNFLSYPVYLPPPFLLFRWSALYAVRLLTAVLFAINAIFFAAPAHFPFTCTFLFKKPPS